MRMFTHAYFAVSLSPCLASWCVRVCREPVARLCAIQKKVRVSREPVARFSVCSMARSLVLRGVVCVRSRGLLPRGLLS